LRAVSAIAHLSTALRLKPDYAEVKDELRELGMAPSVDPVALWHLTETVSVKPGCHGEESERKASAKRCSDFRDKVCLTWEAEGFLTRVSRIK